MIKQHLYFISIIPPQPMKGMIQNVKQLFAEKYKVYHALKSPPHITLVPPFKLDDDKEHAITGFLRGFATHKRAFQVSIEDFGGFKPRVIFLKPQASEELQALHWQLKRQFYEAFQVGQPSKKPFHPHLTIAFRDLTPHIFKAAWQEYRDKSLKIQFTVDRIHLLKHNGKSWDEYCAFCF